MVVAIEKDLDMRLRVGLAGHTNAVYASIIGALSDKDGAGWDAMQEFIQRMLNAPEEPGEVPYDLDPNARPEAGFEALMGGANVGAQRVPAEATLQHPEMGPIAARLRELEAQKAN